MHAHSYKYYLQALEKKPGFSLLQKMLLFILALFLITGGIVSAFSFWEYYKESPLRAENYYLQSISSDFSAGNSSLSEIMSTFQVAGAKVKAVDALKEATPTAEGYFVSLDDIDKTIAETQAAQKNLLDEKNQLSKMDTPQKFLDIRKDLLDYYNSAQDSLDNLLEEQKFSRGILIASGTSFYLPVLTDETLWKAQKVQPIIDYYEAKKREANIALADLSVLTIPSDFKEYYDTQISYLELLVNTADDINQTLSKANDTTKDSVPQIEKAYQKLFEAQTKNEALSQKLLAQKLQVFDQKRNLQKLAPVSLKANSIEVKLADLSANQPQAKTYQIPETLINATNDGRNFLLGIQNTLNIW